MGSKGRMPPAHMRRPLPGPGLLHPDPFGPGMRPLPGDFPFDMLPPPEIMEQKLDAQQVEMQRLLTENQRIAATHSTLRQELAAAQHELQRLQSHMGALNAEQEQQMRVVFDKIAKMEADLQASEPMKMELQQARGELQSLIAARHELFSKFQQLNQDLHRSRDDTQQIPALMSELDSLKQDYHHCRTTYDYETKLRNDHSEQLQVMEKNYVSMVREVEALRSELAKASNPDKSGGAYASNAGYKESDTPTHQSTGQNTYEDGYGVPQGRGPSVGLTNYGGDQTGQAPVRAGYDVSRGAAYEASRNQGYDAPRAGSYEAPRGGGYDATRGVGSTQPAMAAGNSSAPYGSVPYGSAQPHNYGSAVQAQPPNYGAAQPPNYGSAQPPNYGSAQPPSYGSAQPPNYGSAGQAPNAYGASQAPGTYRTQTPTQAAPAAGGGGYEAAHGGNAARR